MASQSRKKQYSIPKVDFLCQGYKKGEKLTEENIRIIRPGYGMAPKYYPMALGQEALCDIERGNRYSWR